MGAGENASSRMGVRPEDLHEYLRQRPFRPFRITLTDGRTFDVRHHELIMVGCTSVDIGIPSHRHLDPTYERVVSAPLSHVAQIEPISESDAV